MKVNGHINECSTGLYWGSVCTFTLILSGGQGQVLVRLLSASKDRVKCCHCKVRPNATLFKSTSALDKKASFGLDHTGGKLHRRRSYMSAPPNACTVPRNKLEGYICDLVISPIITGLHGRSEHCCGIAVVLSIISRKIDVCIHYPSCNCILGVGIKDSESPQKRLFLFGGLSSRN